MLIIRSSINQTTRQQSDGAALALAVDATKHLVIRNAELNSLSVHVTNAALLSCAAQRSHLRN